MWHRARTHCWDSSFSVKLFSGAIGDNNNLASQNAAQVAWSSIWLIDLQIKTLTPVWATTRRSLAFSLGEAELFPQHHDEAAPSFLYCSLCGKSEFSAPNKDFCSELFLHNSIAIEDFLLRRASPPPSTPPFLPCTQDFFRPYFLRTGNSDTSPLSGICKDPEDCERILIMGIYYPSVFL